LKHTTIIRNLATEENTGCYESGENAIKYDTMPFRYEWRFGDGKNGVGSRVEHCYSGAGTYNVELDVVNLITKEKTVNEKSEILIVKDIEQPYISCPEVFTAGSLVNLSADSTNLPGWDIARFYWNFGDETIAIGKNVDKIYSRPGTYNIQLIVTTKPETGGIVREACVSKDILIKQQP
jgi:PKD repeat protein